MKILSTFRKRIMTTKKSDNEKKPKRGHSETGMSKYKYRCFTGTFMYCKCKSYWFELSSFKDVLSYRQLQLLC